MMLAERAALPIGTESRGRQCQLQSVGLSSDVAWPSFVRNGSAAYRADS